jgi:hypothetical protein
MYAPYGISWSYAPVKDVEATPRLHVKEAIGATPYGMELRHCGRDRSYIFPIKRCRSYAPLEETRATPLLEETEVTALWKKLELRPCGRVIGHYCEIWGQNT